MRILMGIQEPTIWVTRLPGLHPNTCIMYRLEAPGKDFPSQALAMALDSEQRRLEGTVGGMAFLCQGSHTPKKATPT